MYQEIYLPNGVRNISKKFNESNNCVLSAGDRLAVAGIRFLPRFRLQITSDPIGAWN